MTILFWLLVVLFSITLCGIVTVIRLFEKMYDDTKKMQGGKHV